MATACDVAAYILEQRGSMTAMKLQKLVYYSQAWHLAWEEVPLFDDRIEAWANGPVVARLFREHRGKFEVSPGEISGAGGNLTADERESVDTVLLTYGDYEPFQLSELTHREAPWKDARKGMSPGERGCSLIEPQAMLEYYSGLLAAE